MQKLSNKYIELDSIGKVTKYLDINGYKTNQSKKFSKQSVINILSNDFYRGIIRHGDIVKEGKHTPIINKIAFGKVQAKLKEKSRQG